MEHESAPRCFPYASQIVGWPMFFLLPERSEGAENMPRNLRKRVRMKLTKANIAKVAVPHGKSEVIVFDDDVLGWGLRVRTGGFGPLDFPISAGQQTAPP